MSIDKLIENALSLPRSVGIPWFCQCVVKDCNHFFSWAFGDLSEYSKFIDLMHAWNDKHGDLFKLQPTDKIIDSICDMLRAYHDNFGDNYILNESNVDEKMPG